MASQTQPVTTTDVLNYAGELFYLGDTFGKSPLLTESGRRNGFKVSGSTNFSMGNFFTGDAAAQDDEAANVARVLERVVEGHGRSE